MEKVNLLLLDVEEKKLKEIICDNDNLETFYKHLNCDCFDIANRKIGDKRFDCFVYDIGLFVENPVVSAIDMNNQPMLVGNIIFANHDAEGNTTSLTNEDKQTIRDNTHWMIAENRKTHELRDLLIVKMDY